jgi:hypothetical protein
MEHHRVSYFAPKHHSNHYDKHKQKKMIHMFIHRDELSEALIFKPIEPFQDSLTVFADILRNYNFTAGSLFAMTKTSEQGGIVCRSECF